MKYPEPSELTPAQIELRTLALRCGRAIADQHPGVQISEHVEEAHERIRIELQHPVHSWTDAVYFHQSDEAGGLEGAAKRSAMGHYLELWMDRLHAALKATQCTNANGDAMQVEGGILALTELMRKVQGSGRKVIFVGNGGSASIASHMAEDFTKNGKVRAVTFNDAALLTCFANDYGWWNVFLEAVRQYGDPGDVLVAISSSGNSANIMAAATEAKAKGIVPVTLSGFLPDNKLRSMGTLNFYTPAGQYGFVETAHAALLHAALDIHMGWVGQQ